MQCCCALSLPSVCLLSARRRARWCECWPDRSCLLSQIGEERASKRINRKMRKTSKGKKLRTWGTGRRAMLHKQKKAARDV